jgi:hypothetical protein
VVNYPGATMSLNGFDRSVLKHPTAFMLALNLRVPPRSVGLRPPPRNPSQAHTLSPRRSVHQANSPLSGEGIASLASDCVTSLDSHGSGVGSSAQSGAVFIPTINGEIA